MRSILILAQAAIITLLAVFGAQSGQTEVEESRFPAPPSVSASAI